jgi:hypothetical protein
MLKKEGTDPFTSSAASGSNAISLTTGQRIDFGSGASDYLYSDGTSVSTPGALAAVGNVSGNAFVGNNNNSIVLQAVNTNAGISVTGALLFGVGTVGSSANQSAIGTYSKNITVVGNAADTSEDNLMTSALPANAMNVDGRGVRVTAWGDGVSTADVTTLRAYFGATVVVSKVLTASQANTWRCVFEVLRTAATTQTATGTIYNGGTANSTAQGNAAPAETLANAITVKFTGQRATTSTANSIRQLGMIVEVFN